MTKGIALILAFYLIAAAAIAVVNWQPLLAVPVVGAAIAAAAWWNNR